MGRYAEKFDCANEVGVRDVHERRDLGVPQRLHRDLSDERGSDEGHEFVQVDDFLGRQDRGTDNGHVECVLAKKSTMCAHLFREV